MQIVLQLCIIVAILLDSRHFSLVLPSNALTEEEVTLQDRLTLAITQLGTSTLQNGLTYRKNSTNRERHFEYLSSHCHFSDPTEQARVTRCLQSITDQDKTPTGRTGLTGMHDLNHADRQSGLGPYPPTVAGFVCRR